MFIPALVQDVLASAQPRLEALAQFTETWRRAQPALKQMAENARYLQGLAKYQPTKIQPVEEQSDAY